jgi:hypothetical protein
LSTLNKNIERREGKTTIAEKLHGCSSRLFWALVWDVRAGLQPTLDTSVGIDFSSEPVGEYENRTVKKVQIIIIYNEKVLKENFEQ